MLHECVSIWTIFSLIVGFSAEATSWERDIAEGKLPEMTLDQQMQLFGGHILVVETTTPPPPEPTTPPLPWWRTIENGSLPPMTDVQKLMLFGSSDVIEETSVTTSPYYDEYYNDERYADDNVSQRTKRQLVAPLNENYTVELLHNIFGALNMPEGRARIQRAIVPIILAMTIVAAILLPALITVIKLIAVSGLWSGVVSLVITKMLGLKALFDHHHHYTGDSDVYRRPVIVVRPYRKYRRNEEEEEEEDYLQQRQAYGQYEPFAQALRRNGQVQPGA